MKSTHAQMAFDLVDRYKEDGKMKCRKGKECNGRCIPKSHECGGKSAASTGSLHDRFASKNPRDLDGDDVSALMNHFAGKDMKTVTGRDKALRDRYFDPSYCS